MRWKHGVVHDCLQGELNVAHVPACVSDLPLSELLPHAPVACERSEVCGVFLIHGLATKVPELDTRISFPNRVWSYWTLQSRRTSCRLHTRLRRPYGSKPKWLVVGACAFGEPSASTVGPPRREVPYLSGAPVRDYWTGLSGLDATALRSPVWSTPPHFQRAEICELGDDRGEECGATPVGCATYAAGDV